MQGRDALAELQAARDELAAHVSPLIELPAVDLVLDLDSRRGDNGRLAAHLHQMCALHQANFGQANKIKHLYLVDAFLQMAEADNPLALYAISRSMFELSAFLHEVRSRLVQTAGTCTDKTWQPMGEKFFGLIVRARFATTNPAQRELLLKQGFSAKRLEPFNITSCVSGLKSDSDHVDAGERYAVLCDFVHHNLGSSSTANSGSGVADAARSAGGGMIVSNGPMTVIQYEYPARGKLVQAIDDVAPGFLLDVKACIQWTNSMPQSPFAPELLAELTGHPMGMQVLLPPSD
jgi:hypothetical protein